MGTCTEGPTLDTFWTAMAKRRESLLTQPHDGEVAVARVAKPNVVIVMRASMMLLFRERTRIIQP